MNGEGIMGLPMGGEPMPAPAQGRQMFTPEQASAIEFARSQTTPEEVTNETMNALQQADPALVLELRQALAGAQLPQQVLDALKMLVDEILADPASYQETRADLLSDPEVANILGGLLPPTFDAAFFSGLRVALDQVQASPAPGGMGGMGMMGGMPVQGFAAGGIVDLPQMKKVAQELQQMGREGDTILAHINPEEARMLKAMGGSGTINPYTGLPEFIKKLIKGAVNVVKGTVKAVGNVIKKTVDAVGNVVKKIASSPIGRIALTVAAVYFMGPAGLNFAAGTLGVTNAALAAGINTFAASTLVNLASGMKPGDALKQGLFAGVTAGVGTGLTQGFDAMAPGIPATPGTPVPNPNMPIETPIPGQAAAPGGVGTAADLVGEAGVPTASDARFLGSKSVLSPVPIETAVPQPVPNPVYDVGPVPELTSGTSTPTAAAAPSTGPSSVYEITSKGYPTGMGGPEITQVQPIQAVQPADYSLTGTSATNQGIGSLGGTSAAPAAEQGFLDKAYQTTKDAYQSAKDFLSPSAREQAALADAAETANKAADAFKAANPTASAARVEAVWSEAYKAAQPGMFTKYGPLAAAGFGATALLGGFEQPQPDEDPLKDEREKYYESLNSVAPLQVGGGYYGTTAYQPIVPTQAPAYSQYEPIVATQAPIYTAKKGSSPEGVTNFPRKTGAINGPGTGTSDSIPAMLSDGEFVFTAKAVRNFGNGSRRKGAARMYKLMKMLEGGPVKKDGIASLAGAKRG